MTESSMTLAEYLRKINVDLEGDFLREGMRLLAQLVMEGEISEQIGAAKYQRTAGAQDAAERLSRATVGHAGRVDRAGNSQAAGRQLLPELHRAAAARRESACWRWCSRRTSRA